MENSSKKKVAIIGGGPSGMLAASYASKGGAYVTLFEKNEKLGKKLYITGKGRCNITNASDNQNIMANTKRNPKFLYSALNNFDSNATISFIESMGIKTKIERGARVFPVSDKSSDILKAFTTLLKESKVDVRLNSCVEKIEKTDNGFIVEANGRKEAFDAVVLATGGASYPQTGSTGDGYKFAKELGHTVTDIHPSLVPFETEETWPSDLSGLSLKNVTLNVFKNNKKVYSELGEMLFTHFGVSGPLVLSASSYVSDSPQGVKLFIDLKPGLTHEELDRRLIRDLQKNNRRIFANSLNELLPMSLIPVIIELSNIEPTISSSDITKKMRQELCNLLKALPLTVKGTRDMKEAIITRGGVKVSEINASTMASKKVEGLYFAGELIDVDALTGGYNLQIACSTGVLAGKSINQEA